MIADEHLIFCEALGRCFDSVPGFEVVGSVGERGEVLAAVADGGAGVLVASEVLIGHPWGLADEIRRRVPSCGITLIASKPSNTLTARALEAGVLSVVPKEARLPQLINAVRSVAAGSKAVSPDMVRPPEPAMARKLNDRELEILRSTVTGASLKEISRELYLAPGTVRNLASSAIRKLTARNRFDAARIAKEHGWI